MSEPEVLPEETPKKSAKVVQKPLERKVIQRQVSYTPEVLAASRALSERNLARAVLIKEAHNSLPQHRGTGSGGTYIKNMAKSPKRGGAWAGEGPKHWAERWAAKQERAKMGTLFTNFIKLMELKVTTEKDVAKRHEAVESEQFEPIYDKLQRALTAPEVEDKQAELFKKDLALLDKLYEDISTNKGAIEQSKRTLKQMDTAIAAMPFGK